MESGIRNRIPTDKFMRSQFNSVNTNLAHEIVRSITLNTYDIIDSDVYKWFDKPITEDKLVR